MATIAKFAIPGANTSDGGSSMTVAEFKRSYCKFIQAVHRDVLNIPDLQLYTAKKDASIGSSGDTRVNEVVPEWFDSRNGTWETSPCQFPGCNSVAAMYPLFCDTHGPTVYELSIRWSTLPGTDMMGLFAERDFEEGECVALYHGDIVDTLRGYKGDAYMLAFPMLTLQRHTTTYIQTVTMPRVSLDAQSTQSCVARWANDGNGSTPKVANNTELQALMHQDNHTCILYLRATRCIARNEEVLLNYGDFYWLKV